KWPGRSRWLMSVNAASASARNASRSTTTSSCLPARSTRTPSAVSLRESVGSPPRGDNGGCLYRGGDFGGGVHVDFRFGQGLSARGFRQISSALEALAERVALTWHLRAGQHAEIDRGRNQGAGDDEPSPAHIGAEAALAGLVQPVAHEPDEGEKASRSHVRIGTSIRDERQQQEINGPGERDDRSRLDLRLAGEAARIDVPDLGRRGLIHAGERVII